MVGSGDPEGVVRTVARSRRRGMRAKVRMRTVVASVFAVALVLTACSKNTSGGSGSTTTAGGGSPSSATSASPTLNVPLKTAGVLTIGACIPAPGFENGTLANPTGFEVDIVNEIA